MLIIIPNSDAYKVAKQYLLTNPQIKNELGRVKGFSLSPFSEFQINSVNGKESGNVNMDITVKGEVKYKDIHISLMKNFETQWIVTNPEK